MADTPSSSPFGTPFSSSSDTLSWKSTPPSSPDDNYDTPTKKPSSRSKTSLSPVPFNLSRLNDEEVHEETDEESDDYDDLSAPHVDSAGCHTGPSTPSGGKCSKRSSQQPGYDDAATGHPIRAWPRMESGRHAKPSSQTVNGLVSDNQERCISSEADSISSPSSDTPDIEPSPTGPSCHESDDTRVSSFPDLFFVEDQSPESSPFDHKIETPSKKDGAEAGLSTTHGGERSRSDTLGANLTQRRDTPRRRSHSPVDNSFPPAISDIPAVHAVQNVERKFPDVSQPDNDSIQTISSHGSRDPKDLNPTTNTAKSQRKSSRAGEKIFEYTEKSLREILPCEMGRLFDADPSICVAIAQKTHERCENPNKGSDSDLPAQLRLFANINISEARPCIEKLFASIVCGMHKNVAVRRWEYWKDVFPKSEPASNNIDDPRLSRLVDWFQEVQDGAKSLGPSAGPGIKAEDEQVDGPAKPIATFQQLVPHCPKWQKTASVCQTLRRICVSSLTQNEERLAGFIYIHSSSEGLERMKIGWAKDINARLQQLDKCERGLSLYFPKGADKGLPIPHVCRVEKLVHAELKNYRRKLPDCLKCRKDHIEWFEGVSAGFAADVVRKWTQWMMRRPYLSSDYEGMVEWALSDEALDSLKTVCKPHEKLRSGFFPTKT